jgi:hypothetical protein
VIHDIDQSLFLKSFRLAGMVMLSWFSVAVVSSQDVPSPPGPPGAPAGGTTSPALGESTARSSTVEIPTLDWGEDYQVRVTGGQPRVRVTFYSFINDYRNDFRWLLYRLNPEAPVERNQWSIPIEVALWGEVTDVHKGDYLITKVQVRPDQRFIIKVEVKLHDAFQESAFRLKLLEALLIEQVIAPYALSTGDFALQKVEVPEWILHGFDQLISHRRGGSPSAFYRGFLTSGQMLKPDEIVAVKGADKLDAVDYAIFRASASAMVEALLDQPEGDAGMRSLLGDLGRPGAVSLDVLLRQHFPAVREMDEGLEKWWALEVASLGQQQGFEFLGREETERILDEALTLRFEGVPESAPVAKPVKKGLFEFGKAKDEDIPAVSTGPFVGTIDQYQSYLGRAGTNEKLTRAFENIQHLKRSGFPLYRPVFTAYEAVITKLVKGDVKGLDEELASLAEMRTKIRETLVRTEDYLNYFEATRAPQRSAAFDEYMKVRKMLDDAPAPRRNDRISQYIDALEVEFR